MKKKIILLALIIMACFTTVAFAAEEKQTNYQPASTPTTEAEWWDWFNSLPADIQQRINFRPGSNKRQSESTQETGLSQGAEVSELSSRASLLPTGGGEPVYNFNYWEENKLYANCYIYAMDVITSTVGGVNPGHYGGGEITFEDLSKSNICSLMYTGTKNDGPYLGNGRSIRSSSKNEKPRSNEYKVAIVIAPGVDYHWYVQNSDGYWSHKPGTTSCTKVDASGNFITDPQTANRNYSYANYSKFCGYYIMTRN